MTKPMPDDIEKKEKQLQERLDKIKALEAEVKKREKAVKDKEKQMIVRLSPSLWNEIASWAEEDFRSINGQVEYLLSECVRRRKNKET